MTVIPVAILLLFLVVMAGGPREMLILTERWLQTFLEWVARLAA